ncbi:MAG: glycosyltransferase [Acidimicrobiales bacterium]
MKIVVEGASKLDASYGFVNVRLGMALVGLGHEVTLSPWDQSVESCGKAIAHAYPSCAGMSITTADRIDAEVRIRQIWPPVWSRPHDDSRLVVIQPWEFGSVPLSWLEGVSSADAIWVPSSFVKAGYVQSGVDPDKVWVVPNGADVSSSLPSRDTRQAGQMLSLLFVGGGIYRKGIDVLVAALDSLDDDALGRVRLTIKETGYSTYYAGQSLVESTLKGTPRVASRTEVVRDHLTPAQLGEMYASADCLVHPYRSEGFALPVLEAMSTGLPVVVTSGGATDDFCGDSEALRLASTLTVSNTPYVGDILTADYPYHREPSASQLASVVGKLLASEIDIEPLRRAAFGRAREYQWERIGAVAQRSLTALADGRGPEDAFGTAATEVRRFVVNQEHGTWVPVVASLLAVGDQKGALRVTEVEATRGPTDATLVHFLSQLRGASSSSPDLWSGATWRLDLAAALREHADVPLVVHRYEGDHSAVTAIAGSIAPYFSGCKHVLDLGCGLGAMMRTLRATGKEVTGIDGDPDLVDNLRAEGFSVDQGWIPEDLDKLSDLGFDGVFMGHIVEHLPTDQALDVLRWVADHIDDGGTIVIQTPDFANDFVCKTNFWLDPTHKRPYPVSLLTSMLESSGFAPLAGGCRSLAPHAPLDVIAVGRLHKVRACSSRQSTSTRPWPTRHVLHFGLFQSDSGMGHASRTLLDPAKLASDGVEVIRIELGSESDRQLPPGTSSLSESLDLPADIAVVDAPIGWLPDLLPRVRARRYVVRLAFEARPLPGYIVDALRGAAEIWPMSDFVQKSASESGLDGERLVVIPPAVAVQADAESGFAGTGNGARPAIYSSVFNFEPRKNPEALLRAYLQVLRSGRDVRLVLKTSGIDEASFWQWAGTVVGPDGRDELQRSCDLLTTRLDDAVLQDVIRHSDAFVLPSRGEGFGLPFLEAMAVGVPVICPDRGGHRDFCDGETSFLVPTREVPCIAQWNIPLFRESSWYDVDQQGLIDAMERVADDPETVVKKAALSLMRARDMAALDQQSVVQSRIAALIRS